jgi:hypothetical protein
MTLRFEDLIALWAKPLPPGSDGVSKFAKVYGDPVRINGVVTPLAALVDRARALQSAYADLEGTLLARSDTGTHTTIVFRMRGRHVGPLVTPLGELPATGKIAERQVIDLLKIESGLITELWMVSDELSALTQLGAIDLVRAG